MGNQHVYHDEQDLGFNAHHKPAENESPGNKGNTNVSPTKGQARKSMYPNAFSSSKKAAKTKPKLSPSKKKENEKQESGLVSPTSI
jgi:hypothetical protein